MGLGAYLLFFCGWTTVNFLGQRRAAYRQLQREAADEKSRLELYDSRVVRLHRLMDAAQMDPAQLSKPRLVARASAAIQQAAMQGGLQM